MAYEDWTTYTEVDPQPCVTVTANKIDLYNPMDRANDTYVYIDKGVNYFAADFSFKWEFTYQPNSAEGVCISCCLANVIDDLNGMMTASEDLVSVYAYSPNPGTDEYIYLHCYDSVGGIKTDSWHNGPVNGTKYFLELTRDDDGGASSKGQITLYIRITSHLGALQDTLQVDMEDQVDFRYIYGLQSGNTAQGARSMAGEVENMLLDAGDVTADADLDLPMKTMDAHAGGTGDVTLPVKVVAGYTGGVAELTLPMKTMDAYGKQPVDADITLPTKYLVGIQKYKVANIILPLKSLLAGQLVVGDFDEELPLFQVDGESPSQPIVADVTLPAKFITTAAQVEMFASGEITLPTLVVEGKAGIYGDATLPMLVVTGTGVAGRVASWGEGTLPIFTVAATAQVQAIITLDETLPLFVVDGAATHSIFADASLTLPALVVDTEQAKTGEVGTFAQTLPLFSVSATSHEDATGDGDMELPLFDVYGRSRIRGRFEGEVLRHYRDPRW